jgi:hypothetical protein
MGKVTFTDWKPQRVKASIADAVEENMKYACVFVQLRARANLMGIANPPEWRRYRQRFLGPLVDFEITKDGDDIIGRVGIRQKEEWRGGYFIEIGRKNLPAHPWLRPALFNNARDIVRILGG